MTPKRNEIQYRLSYLSIWGKNKQRIQLKSRNSQIIVHKGNVFQNSILQSEWMRFLSVLRTWNWRSAYYGSHGSQWLSCGHIGARWWWLSGSRLNNRSLRSQEIEVGDQSSKRGDWLFVANDRSQMGCILGAITALRSHKYSTEIHNKLGYPGIPWCKLQVPLEHHTLKRPSDTTGRYPRCGCKLIRSGWLLHWW